MRKRIIALGLSILMLMGLTGCDNLPANKFNDYNVSGYIKALLDSSYKGTHSNYVNYSNETEAAAVENSRITMENGAVQFCNTYDVSPTDAQMDAIVAFITQAYALTKYVVKEEEKTTTGYSVDVEIQPLTTFTNNASAFVAAYNKAQSDAQNQTNNSNSSPYSSKSSEAAEDDWDQDWDEDWADESEIAPTPSPTPQPVDPAQTYADEVIRICKETLSGGTPTYGSTVTITLNILLDESGNLSLDTTQIEEIDLTVIQFSK